MQLRQLEEQLELALFEPVGRGLQMTEPGREMAALATDLLLRLDDFTRASGELRGVRRGRVRLGIVSTAKYFAPRLLAQFLKSHPGLDVRLNVYNRERIIEQLQSYAIDLGIMGLPPEGVAREIEQILLEWAEPRAANGSSSQGGQGPQPTVAAP